MKELNEAPLEPTIINPVLAQRIQDELGQNVYLCYQCVKCSSGCPLSEYFDWQPNQIMRALQLGEENIALHSKTPWLCASCQTCTTRCPQDLDIAAIMDFLTREALENNITAPFTQFPIFTEAFMREVNMWGRAFELGLMAEMKLRTFDLTSDLDLGIRMLRKHKFPLLPSPSYPPKKVKPIPQASNSVAYYPGCSLHSTATEFDKSTRAVCEALGITLIEPEHWVCCGSSAAHRANPDEALRLPMTNLGLIERYGFSEVTMPCAACFNRHKAAQFEIRHNEQKKQRVDKATGYSYQDTVQVDTVIQTIHKHIGAEKVKSMVKKPMSGLNVVCYYGCLLTRPPEITEAKHHENPTDMEELMEALGATVLDWSYKTSCCGAAHSLTRPDIVHKLSSEIINQARLAGADVITVACPLCHMNLDARQFQMKIEQPMPIMYFTQLLSLGLGLPERSAALHKNLVDPRPLLTSREILPVD